MMTSTTSKPGGGETLVLNETLSEYAGPRSELAIASISRLVCSLNRRNVPAG
jgi:hypothetical protein